MDSPKDKIEHNLRSISTVSFDRKKLLDGKGTSTLNLTRNYLLMHPSTMRKLNCNKGCLILLHSEDNQLLFKCWPCTSILPDSIMLPSLSYFYNNLKNNILAECYNLFVDIAIDIVLSCEDKKFMKTKDFETFMRSHFDSFYLTEGLVLSISYHGYPLSFTVRKITSTIEEDPQQHLDEICKNISSLDISGDNFDELTLTQYSTPISKCSKSVFDKSLNFESNAVNRQKKFYLVYCTTKFTFISPKTSSSSCDQITLHDLVGLEEQISKMKYSIECVLKNDSFYENYGIIFIGPCGTGKTSLVQALQNEYQLPLFKINNHTLARNERNLKDEWQDLFRKAIDNSPSIIFIDDIDTTSNNTSSSKQKRLVTYLSALIEDVVDSKKRVIIIGAARNIFEIDSSLRERGTLEKEIYFQIPSTDDRQKILGNILDKRNHSLNYNNISELANMTFGYTGGDLRMLCDKASISLFDRRENADDCITFEDFKSVIKDMNPSSVAGFAFEKPNTKWSDIGGMENVKTAITEMVDWPLKHAEQFKKFKMTPARGILLYGPPGCSKTMIAKALVSESHLNFISIKGPQIFNKYVGESEKAVSDIFKKACSAAPCVIFFDEIDSLASIRGSTSGNSNVADRILNQLLSEIDGIEVLEGVSIVAATNRPDMIDPSFLRPGRFDRMIYVPLPDASTRNEIFRVKLKNMPISTDVDVTYLVQATEGYTGAEITDVCRESAMLVIKDHITRSVSTVSMVHFISALESIKPRTSKEMTEFYETYNKRNTSANV